MQLRQLLLCCAAVGRAVWLHSDVQTAEASEEVQDSADEMAVLEHFRYQLDAQRLSNSSQAFDCELFPGACKPPFNCHLVAEAEAAWKQELKRFHTLQKVWERNRTKLQNKKEYWQRSVEEWERRQLQRKEEQVKRTAEAIAAGKELAEEPEDSSPEPMPPKNFLEEEAAQRPKPQKPKRPWATADGHANFQQWCTAPKQYLMPALSCQAGDLRTYAREMRAAQKPFFASIDSHYCFSMGHCDNHEVTPETTLEEAEEICDRRFGHETWTQMDGLGIGVQDVRFGVAPHLSTGAQKSFAAMACAMGNFHCDVIYCQQEYCSDPFHRAMWDRVRPPIMRQRNGQNYPPLKPAWVPATESERGA